MNDFTKEELITLRSAVANFDFDDPSYDKIQSLIDNYECEHFGIIKLDDNFNPISNTECLFCHKLME